MRRTITMRRRSQLSRSITRSASDVSETESAAEAGDTDTIPPNKQQVDNNNGDTDMESQTFLVPNGRMSAPTDNVIGNSDLLTSTTGEYFSYFNNNRKGSSTGATQSTVKPKRKNSNHGLREMLAMAEQQLATENTKKTTGVKRKNSNDATADLADYLDDLEDYDDSTAVPSSPTPSSPKIPIFFCKNNKISMDKIQQALSVHDTTSKGYLTNDDIYKIVQEQLAFQSDTASYKRATLSLLLFAVVLLLSTIGSGVTLVNENRADVATGAMHDSRGGIVGYDSIAETYELLQLSSTEYDERKDMVLAELEEDIESELHLHRLIGHDDNKCQCSDIAFDQVKLDYGDFMTIVHKCDGINTVNVMRRWRHLDGNGEEDNDDEGDYDLVILCRPGVTTLKRGKDDKGEEVLEQVIFRQPSEVDGDVSFYCENGLW